MSFSFQPVINRFIVFVILIAISLLVLIKACAVENYRYYVGEVIEVFHCEERSCAIKVRYHNGYIRHQVTSGLVGEGFARYLVCWGDLNVEKADCYEEKIEPEGVKLAPFDP